MHQYSFLSSSTFRPQFQQTLGLGVGNENFLGKKKEDHINASPVSPFGSFNPLLSGQGREGRQPAADCSEQNMKGNM